MSHTPFFSIVLTTYNRGSHIKPTIESVMQQTFDDFELIVVGDGCNDSTEHVVKSLGLKKIAWKNLEQNSGSQSFPNNEGIRHSRGNWICYLGHDDIWEPDHLARLREVILSNEGTDFAISGCIYYGPNDSETYFVTGLFESSDAAAHHFFPPSSLAHRRDVVDRIGWWRDPGSIRAPVDAEFLLRAANSGMRFCSTTCITVHKFAAGHRYLFYLRPSSSEQTAVLRSFNSSSKKRNDRIIEIAKKQGLFMAMTYPDFPQDEESHSRWLVGYRRGKGLALPPPRPLVSHTVIEQSDDQRGLDWHGLEHASRPFRWSGPNPRPKILIPFTGGWVRIELRLHCAPSAEISVLVEDRKVDHVMEVRSDAACSIVFFARLSRSDYTVLTLDTSRCHSRDERIDYGLRATGVAVSDIVVQPLSWRDLISLWLGRTLSISTAIHRAPTHFAYQPVPVCT